MTSLRVPRPVSSTLLAGVLAASALTSSVLTAGVAAAAPAAAAPTPAGAGSGALRTLVAGLPVATEVRTGYSRDLFKLWIDADGNGCDTREEVLIAESTSTPSTGSGCAVSGTWFSYYDEQTWTASGDVDIDHVVSVAV